MQITFNKEEDKWYVDLLDWDGSKADLQMVMGADTLLDLIAKDIKRTTKEKTLRTRVTIEIISAVEMRGIGIDHVQLIEDPYDHRGTMKLVNNGQTYGKDYEYEYTETDHIPKWINHVGEAWLCPVVLNVFGFYPNYIYFTVKI